MEVIMKIIWALLVVQIVFAAPGSKPSICDSVCPDDFPIVHNYHLSYPGDVTKFCHCANDGNWEKDCPPRLRFDPILQVCDWPAAPTAVPTAVPTSVPTTSKSFDICDTVCPNIWPIVNNNHLPYPGNVTKFCHCANDGNWEKECPAGLHFNPTLQVCDWPATSTAVPTAVPTTVFTTSKSSDICDIVCPNVWPILNNNHLPYPGNVTKFCHCANDGNWEKECPAGLHFNPTLQVCDWPATSTAVPTAVPTTVPTTSKSSDICDTVCPIVWPIVNNNHLPYPGNVTKFCHCANDGNWEKECPIGLHFNPTLQVCDWPATPTAAPTAVPTAVPTTSKSSDICDTVCPIIWPIVNNNHLPYPGNVTKFCHCANDGNWEKECPAGLHFNPTLRVCGWPATSTAVPTAGPTTVPTSFKPSDICNTVCLNTWPIVNNNHLPYPGNVNKFCHCANDGNWEKNCPAGLHFSPSLEVCDWPFNVIS